MREPNRDKGRLKDILEAADYVSSFLNGLDYEGFLADKLRYFAILKNVEIIGEASYMISLPLKESHPEVPWVDIIKMRHVLVHGYSSILPELLWDTAVNEVPKYKVQVKAILDEIGL